MLFAKYGQAILAAQERSSRLLLMTRQPGKAADPTAAQLLHWFAPLPKALRRRCTFDNGTEFARHYRLAETIGMQTYFFDTHSPWQKGGGDPQPVLPAPQSGGQLDLCLACAGRCEQ